MVFFTSIMAFKVLYVLPWLRDYKIVDTLLYFRQRYLHDKVERYKKYSDYMIYVTEAMPDGKCRTVRTQHKIWFDNEFILWPWNTNIFYINFVTAEEDLKINSSLGKD